MIAFVAGLLVMAPPVGGVEELPRLLQEEYDLLEALDGLDDDRRQQEQRLAENHRQRIDVTERLERAARAHEKALNTLERERERIRRRIRVYLELKRVKDWQVLASSSDYASYLRKRRLFKQLLEDDEGRITAYHKVVERYRNAKDTHSHALRRLQEVQTALRSAQRTLERDNAVKLALLESIRSDKAFFIKAGRDLNQAAKRLQEQINNFQKWRGKRLWFRDLKGQYLYPVPGGKVLRDFGRKIHPRFGTVTMHRGMDFIPGKKGIRLVRGLYWGKVVFAGWLNGFGNTVILDHTDKDYTLYAHLARIDVQVGDVVKSREILGELGGSGSLDGEKLYFELRIDGKPVDPSRWFRR